jgi:hypothetical protein
MTKFLTQVPVILGLGPRIQSSASTELAERSILGIKPRITFVVTASSFAIAQGQDSILVARLIPLPLTGRG